jgi:hypothetical protein
VMYVYVVCLSEWCCKMSSVVVNGMLLIDSREIT